MKVDQTDSNLSAGRSKNKEGSMINFSFPVEDDNDSPFYGLIQKLKTGLAFQFKRNIHNQSKICFEQVTQTEWSNASIVSQKRINTLDRLMYPYAGK